MMTKNNSAEKILESSKFIKSLNLPGDKLHSEAGLYSSLGHKYVIKKIGRQYKLNSKELINLEKSISIYYELLKQILPKNIPQIFYTKIDNKENYILLITEYFPKGKISEIKNSQIRIKYFAEIIKLINKIANARGNNLSKRLICSIDPNPDNFFLDSKNNTVYNDFTPPLYRENGKWVEFRRKDEVHAKKSDKETRYFTELNLLLAFINKVRLYLTLPEYYEFLKLYLSTKYKLEKFVEIFNEVHSKRVANFDKYDKHVVRRDLIRFALSFKEGMTSIQIKEIYKKSKQPNGTAFLEKKYISLIS